MTLSSDICCACQLSDTAEVNFAFLMGIVSFDYCCLAQFHVPSHHV